MKQQIDDYIAKYGNENSPPPWQVFTIANEVREGNVHLVQKIFDGAFEVCPNVFGKIVPVLIETSLISCIRLLLHRSQ